MSTIEKADIANEKANSWTIQDTPVNSRFINIRDCLTVWSN